MMFMGDAYFGIDDVRWRNYLWVRINESTNQRINETGNVHESRHCGML